jgi:predicted DCC family thiol-disulfide oxidoreductase YuxK
MGVSGASESAGVVLYDSACGFCSRWVPYWAPTLKRARFDIAPLQDPRYSARIDLEVPDSWDFTLLLPDGRRILGADAYRCVMRRIWWAYPLFLLSIVPGLRSAFDWGYTTFAQNRYCVSRAVGLESTTRNFED